MIHRSVKTEVGDGDRYPALAVWPWPRHEFYIGDMDQVVGSYFCRLLSARDEKWNVAEATSCRVRSTGLSSRLARTLQRNNA